MSVKIRINSDKVLLLQSGQYMIRGKEYGESITFPISYSYNPFVVLTSFCKTYSNPNLTTMPIRVISSVSTNSFSTVYLSGYWSYPAEILTEIQGFSFESDVYINWIAIGQKNE